MRKILLFTFAFVLSAIFCSAQKLSLTDVNSPAVTVLVDIKVNPKFKSETKSFVGELVAQTMKEPNIISYNYYLSPDEEKILIVEQYKSLSAFQDHGKTLFAGPLGDRFKSHFTVNSITMAGGSLPDSVQNFRIMKTIGGFSPTCP